MADWSLEHIARVRNKAATGDGLGPFWRELVVEALDQLAAAKSTPATGQPVAWRHEIKEPDHDWTTMFSGSSDNPWSHWVATYKAGCEYRVTPLYAATPTEDGWQLVPRTLTDAMIEAARSVDDGPLRTYQEHWDIMLAAAPDQSSEDEKEGQA